MATNECIPFYEDGDHITGYCTAAITGKTFVMISGNRSGGTFDPTQTAIPADKGAPNIAPATAAGRIFGVAGYDGASGGHIEVIRGSKMVVPVTAGAALNAFQEVEVGPAQGAVPHAAGVAVGFALTGCAVGADAQISLY
jgi:hypothetical protein